MAGISGKLMAQHDGGSGHGLLNLPYLKSDLSEAVNHFETDPVRSDQPGAVRTRGQCDEHVEMKVAKFARRKTVRQVNLCQDLSRLPPILFRWSQNRTISRQSSQKFTLVSLGGAAPQLRQDNGRCTDQSGNRSDSLLMAPGTQSIDQDRPVEDDEFTHSPLLIACGKLEFAPVLLHQTFKTFECDSLAKSHVNRLGTGSRRIDVMVTAIRSAPCIYTRITLYIRVNGESVLGCIGSSRAAMIRPMRLSSLAIITLLSLSPFAQKAVWEPAPSHVSLNLWPHGAPGAAPSSAAEVDTTTANDRLVAGKPVLRLGNVSVPTLTVYSPPGKNTGAAIVVFPGGSYHILAIDLEGTEVCDWLNSVGIACVLVKYRVPDSGPYPKSAAALQDAQRAVGIVRSHAVEWHIDPHRIGVLGFSAGAHLSAALSTHFDQRLYDPIDDADKTSCRPDFAVVLYPVMLVCKKAFEPGRIVVGEHKRGVL